jgi:hypothetical protein
MQTSVEAREREIDRLIRSSMSYGNHGKGKPDAMWCYDSRCHLDGGPPHYRQSACPPRET